MNRLKPVVLVLFIVAYVQAPSRAFGQSVGMDARFSEVETEHPTCDQVFEQVTYSIDFHVLNQPRGAVIHFKDHDGFFAESNLVARRGYDDLYVEKITRRDQFPGIAFKIKAEGIYDSNLILLDFNVIVQDETSADSPIICAAKAQLFATRPNK